MPRSGRPRRGSRAAGRPGRGLPAPREGTNRPEEAGPDHLGESSGSPDVPASSAALETTGRAAATGGPRVGTWRRTAVDGFLDRWYVFLGLAILVIAASLRLPELALNPFHHDEGVNGFFTTRLVRSNAYAYDPANYHGPSLYYFALLSAIFFGLNDVALRLVTVVAGLATVALVLPLRAYLGSMATLTAALLLAVSPGAVYVSRYFIHEALLVCFTLGLVVSILLYV